jgi:hypothetical protein
VLSFHLCKHCLGPQHMSENEPTGRRLQVLRASDLGWCHNILPHRPARPLQSSSSNLSRRHSPCGPASARLRCLVQPYCGTTALCPRPMGRRSTLLDPAGIFGGPRRWRRNLRAPPAPLYSLYFKICRFGEKTNSSTTSK